jgi:predicted nucleic acid-binding protein
VKEVFADTQYFIAILSEGDDFHELATAHADELATRQDTRLVTTDAVLMELLNAFARGGQEARRRAADFVSALLDDPAALVIAQTRDRLRSAIQRYGERLDKDWSVVDCISMLVMEERGIGEALTHDHDFEQAGFKVLL